MTLQTFVPPIDPQPGTSSRPQLRLLTAEFGDGYTQTTRAGMNHIRRELSLVWETISAADAKAITDFLELHGGDQPFYYALPGEASEDPEALPPKWTCEEWATDYQSAGIRKVTARFKENFSIHVGQMPDYSMDGRKNVNDVMPPP